MAISLCLNNRSLGAACAFAGARVCCAVQAAVLGTTCVGLCSLRMRSARTQAKAAQIGLRKTRFFHSNKTCFHSSRHVLRRRIRTSKDPLHGLSFSRIFASSRLESRRTDHLRSPGVASASHQGYTDRCFHYSASPQRLATAETQSEQCLSQQAQQRRRGKPSAAPQKDVRPAPRLRRHRRT